MILIREDPTYNVAISTFDYSDLNAYLLVVVGLAHPEDNQKEIYDNLAAKARDGKPIPLRDIQSLAKKGPFVTLSDSDNLTKAIEYFGSGVHRVIVCKHGTAEVVGILSQLTLVNFLWENGNSFPAIERLYSSTLRDLNIGTQNAISIK